MPTDYEQARRWLQADQWIVSGRTESWTPADGGPRVTPRQAWCSASRHLRSSNVVSWPRVPTKAVYVSVSPTARHACSSDQHYRLWSLAVRAMPTCAHPRLDAHTVSSPTFMCRRAFHVPSASGSHGLHRLISVRTRGGVFGVDRPTIM
jgi:hypothetical protein